MYPAKTLEVQMDEWARSRADVIAAIRESHDEVVGTIDGQPALVMLDLESYREMQQALEDARAYEGVRRGVEAAESGDVMPWREARKNLRNEFPFLNP